MNADEPATKYHTISASNPIPLVVPVNGELYIIPIPRMTVSEFTFFKEQLDLYAPGITKPPVDPRMQMGEP